MNWIELGALIFLGYISNVIAFYAYCQEDESLGILPKILMPTLIIPFLPMFIMSVIMAGMIVALIVAVVLMGVVSIILGVMGLWMWGKKLLRA